MLYTVTPLSTATTERGERVLVQQTQFATRLILAVADTGPRLRPFAVVNCNWRAVHARGLSIYLAYISFATGYGLGCASVEARVLGPSACGCVGRSVSEQVSTYAWHSLTVTALVQHCGLGSTAADRLAFMATNRKDTQIQATISLKGERGKGRWGIVLPPG